MRSKDEFPLLIAGLGFLSVLRGVLVTNQFAKRVSIDYGIGDFSDGDLEAAGYLILLGGLSMILSFVYFEGKAKKPPLDQQEMLIAFMSRHYYLAIAFVVSFIATAKFLAYIAEEHLERTEETNSYATLFSMAGSSLIGILYIAATQLRMSRGAVIISYVGIVTLSILSIATGMRFRVFGWVAIVLYVSLQKASALKQLVAYSIAIVLLAFSLTILGAMRHSWVAESSIEEKTEIGIMSLLELRDVNFIEGMAMLMKVYPDLLDYSMGHEHLEILYRPIPRSWWPGKPMGGWHQKLGVRQGGAVYGTGIAPSLFGSFYQEGGLIGIVLFSAIYGWILAKGIELSKRYTSSVGPFLRAIIFAGFFALYRGGDLPGCYAFVGMSFWPLFIALYFYRRFISDHYTSYQPLLLTENRA